MEEITQYIQDNLAYAPYITFGLLILSGLNIPISEDALLFICGVLARQNPGMLVPLFLGVYLGAYLSDMIAYLLGRFFWPTLWRFKYFRKIISPKRMTQLGKFYQRNGLLTLVLGRFIPFGVRNTLFITAGLSKMNFVKFALYDFFAVSLTSSFYFYLYYSLGTDVIEYIKKGHLILFGGLLLAIAIYFVRKKMSVRKC